jgi:hypothetical protein
VIPSFSATYPRSVDVAARISRAPSVTRTPRYWSCPEDSSLQIATREVAV